MAWSITPLGSGTGTTAATSQSLTGITASAGSLVITQFAIMCANTVTGAVISDSVGGNIWNTHSEADPTTVNGYIVSTWSVLTNALSSASIICTRTGTGNITNFAAAAISATGGAGTEDTAVLNSTQGTSSSPSVTGNAATQSGDLLIAATMWVFSTGNTYAEDGTDGWTNIYGVPSLTAGNGDASLGFAWQVNSGSAGVTYAPKLSASKKWAVLQLGFTPASGAAPFLPPDYPNPVAPARRQDFAAAPVPLPTLTPPFVTPDLTPRLRARWPVDAAIGGAFPLLAPVTAMPFMPADWSNPRLAPRPSELYTAFARAPLAAQPPFIPNEWSNPRRAGAVPKTTFARALPLFTAPFVVPDWHNPLRRPQATDLYTALSRALAPAATPPFVNPDFPNPRLRAFVIPAAANCPLALRGAPPASLPFIPVDWANPRRASPFLWQADAPAAFWLATGPEFDPAEALLSAPRTFALMSRPRTFSLLSDLRTYALLSR